MPLELLATTPPTVQAVSLAGSGPSLRPCRASRALTCADGRARLDAHPGAVVEDLDGAEVAAGVDQHAVVGGLAGQAGAAGAEGQRHPRAALSAQQRGHLRRRRGVTTACGTSR